MSHYSLLTENTPHSQAQLRYKDVFKTDLKALNVDPNTWRAVASERSAWRETVQKGLPRFEEMIAL